MLKIPPSADFIFSKFEQPVKVFNLFCVMLDVNHLHNAFQDLNLYPGGA